MMKTVITAISLVLFASQTIAAEKQILECQTVGKGTLKVSIIETAIENRFSVNYINPNYQVASTPLTAIVASDLKKEKAYFTDDKKMGIGYGRDGFNLTWLNGKPIASMHSNKFTPFLGANFDYCENLSADQGNKVEHALQAEVFYLRGRETSIAFNRNTTPAKVK